MVDDRRNAEAMAVEGTTRTDLDCTHPGRAEALAAKCHLGPAKAPSQITHSQPGQLTQSALVGGAPMSQPRPVVPVDERHDRLSKSEQQYRNLVEVSPDAILLNRGGQVALANPACARLFGARDASELVGRPAIDLFHPDHHDVIRQRIASVIAGMSVPLLEEKIIRLDGQVRDVEVVAAAFPDEDGTAIQVVLRDVTDRKRSEAALKEDERRLRARAAEISWILFLPPYGSRGMIGGP
jgi:PAS domain S-box-containing protein